MRNASRSKSRPSWLSAKALTASLVTGLVLTGGAGCGGDDSSEEGEAALQAAPKIGISSPTARLSAASQLRLGSLASVTAGSDTSIPSATAQRDQLQDAADSLSSEEIMELVTGFRDQVFSANCFGPAVTDNISGSPGGGNRPLGDLGMLHEDSAGDTTEACSAGQLNALAAGVPFNVYQAQLVAIAGLKGWIASLGSEDPDASLVDFMPTNHSTIQFTEANVEFLTGRVLHFRFDFKVSGAAGSIEGWGESVSSADDLAHSFLQIVLPHVSNSPGAPTGLSQGISLLSSTQGDVQTYVLESAANRGVASTDFFDATLARVNFLNDAAGELLNKMVVTQDLAAGSMTMHYAWQAGDADGRSRAFAAEVAGDDVGDTGVAWYGFADPLKVAGMVPSSTSTLGDSTTSIWPELMHCNWLNGLFSGPTVAGLQKQVLVVNSSGIFEASSSDIDFAPTNTCQHGSAFSYSSSDSALDFLESSRTVTAHDLASVPAAGASGVSAVAIPDFLPYSL